MTKKEQKYVQRLEKGDKLYGNEESTKERNALKWAVKKIKEKLV